MLYCTGAPKSGTHLLLKAVELFGVEAHHSHMDFTKPWDADDTHIQIIRNPRNTVISWVRFMKLPRNNETIIGSISYMLKRMEGHFGCIAHPQWYTVRFEELLADPNVIEGIAKHIDLPLAEGHFQSLWGDTRTFTNDLTRWKDFWNDEVNAAWIDKGGIEIEEKMNYFNMYKE